MGIRPAIAVVLVIPFWIVAGVILWHISSPFVMASLATGLVIVYVAAKIREHRP
jgi:hypothetical protein